MRVKFYLFLIFFHLISISAFSEPVDSVEIKIKAPLYKRNRVKLLCSNFLSPQEITFELDISGTGRAKVPVNEKTTWTLAIVGCYSTQILLDKKYDLTIYFENKNKPVFSGNGATVNNYLTEVFLLDERLDTKAYKIDGTVENIDPFLKLVNLYQQKFNALYQKYYPSPIADKELAYILSAINQSCILYQKQRFLNSFEMSLVNELKLEEKLGLDKDNLLNDTIFVKMKNISSLGHFGGYLMSYSNYYQIKTVGVYKPDKETVNEVFSRAFSSIESNPFCSAPIKKEQLFKELYIDFLTFPFSSVLDSVYLFMKNSYPNDPYLEVIDSLRKQNINLKKGNLAPFLQGIDPSGKIVALTDFKGKVVFIDSWSTMCGGCIKSLPHIADIQKHFKDDPNVKFIYLSQDRDKEKWLRYLKNHPQFQGIHLLLQDDRFYEIWNGLSTPQYIIVDKDGKIVNAFAEIFTATKEIEEALNK